jgi:hypothetical protein
MHLVKVIRIGNGYVITSSTGIPISVLPLQCSEEDLGIEIRGAFTQLDKALANDNTTGELPTSDTETGTD